MYCHKCGGVIIAAAARCDHCGTAVDHRTNQEAFQHQQSLTERFSRIPWARPTKIGAFLVIALALVLPALPIPYALEIGHYPLSVLLAPVLATGGALIIVAMAVRKGLSSKHHSTQ